MRFVAIDTETTGLFPIPGRDKIYCVSVNDGKKVYLEENPLKVKVLLEDDKICKVIHNAVFDCYWFQRLYNIKVRNVWDTRLMEQVIIGETLPRSNRNEQQRKELSSSLLYTLPRYGLPVLENKELGKSFATRDRNKPLTQAEKNYAMNDVRYLLQLQALQEYRLLKLDLMKVANLENMVVLKVVDMICRGIGFSEPVWLKLARENTTTYNNLLKRLPATVNWNSPQQVKQYFLSKGILMNSISDIEELAKDYNDKVLNQFIELRKLYKNVTTYGEGWLEDNFKMGRTVDSDNRVRTSFEQILNTGRFSSSNPNLQQIPKDGLHRAAFVPAKGKVFVIGDFGGQELGIMAAGAKEDIWIDAMLRGEDIHSLTASLLYPTLWAEEKEKGCAFPKKCDCKEHKRVREHAKTINFAIAYGAGSQNIGQRLGLTEKESIKLLYKYKKVVPALTRWLDNNSKETIKTRISFSADPYRRRRTIREPEEWQLRTIGKNNPVQSSGANQIKLALASLPEDCPVVLIVHDEIILEVPKAKAKQYAKLLKDVMENAASYCTGISGLIKVEPKIAESLLK